ncbi:hypothetical protein FRC01_011222 [Tulasnella sp. 417]|nr:hypothetical protein FRC01_011222 [Tulasnella sp. 417]
MADTALILLPLDPPIHAQQFRQVANGLAHIHTLEPPIHHGNLKPSKILVDYDNNENLVKITDVGYLEFRNAVEETISFTQVDTMGFAGYPAPETLAANVSSPAADIYALAATILHVISESFPPHADAIRVVEIMKGNKPARVDHPGIPKDHPLWALLENMWTFEAANRPRAGKVQFAIQWIQQHPTEAEKVFCEQCDVVYVPPEKNNLERKGLGEA